ncbi:hypothetical protein Tco_0514726 [Tanacetum coccineum]
MCRAACEAMGLLGDDKEWDTAIQEACVSATLPELRSLFSHIFVHCDVINTSKLWTKYWKEMSHDNPDRVSEMAHILNYHLNDSDVQGYILYEIEMILKNYKLVRLSFGKPLGLKDFLVLLKLLLLVMISTVGED